MLNGINTLMTTKVAPEYQLSTAHLYFSNTDNNYAVIKME